MLRLFAHRGLVDFRINVIIDGNKELLQARFQVYAPETHRQLRHSALCCSSSAQCSVAKYDAAAVTAVLASFAALALCAAEASASL